MYNVSSDELVKNSFYITYAFLMTTATITLIEALRTKNPKIRNILNLETCISISDWFGYTFFEYPKIEKGFCMVNHAGKTAQMSMFCEENLPLLECFSNTKTF